MQSIPYDISRRFKKLAQTCSPETATSRTQPDFIDPAKDKIATTIAEKLGVKPIPEAAIMKPKKQSSFVAILCDLDVGSSAVRNHSPHPMMTIAQLAEELSEMKAMISNNVRPSVRIATEKTGHTFAVETSQTITTTGRVYVQVIVTRTA